MQEIEKRFGAMARLYGQAGFKCLRDAHVSVVGLGGVGGWVVEALARSGIGQLTLVDLDEVCVSNINRQVHALTTTVGQSKAEALRDRIAAIAPDCVVHLDLAFYTAKRSEHFFAQPYSYVVDTIDATQHKCHLIAQARARGQALITCGGAGGCIDPSRIRVDDLSRTINDPLLLQVRKRLRQDYGFPKFKRQKFQIDCVYSDELPRYPQPDGTVSCQRSAGSDYRLNCDFGFGSASYVTGTFGFFLAAHVVQSIVNQGTGDL